MTAKRNVLGRGLGALIEDPTQVREVAQAVEASNEIELSKIEVNPFQPRQHFDAESLEELALSIKQLGVVQPVTLRKIDDNHYQIIAGERRYRAALMAGLEKIPAYVRDANDQGMLEIALVENIHRTDLNAIEIAICYQRLIEECNLTQESLSERISKKRSTIANYLRLLKLPAEIQLGIRQEKISMGHARAIISIDDTAKQIKIFERIVAEDLSVRDVEELVRKLDERLVQSTEQTTKKTDSPGFDKEYKELCEHLSKHFNTNIEFHRNKKGVGKIIIPFKSDEELEKIIVVLDSKKT
jgi:ParB family chromosome partitioning protein